MLADLAMACACAALAQQASSLRPWKSVMPPVSAGLQTSPQGLCTRGASVQQPWREWSQVLERSVTLRARGRGPAGNVRLGGVKSGAAVAVINIAESEKLKFEELPSKRRVFDFKDWEKHKSAGRYIRHIFSAPDSRIIRAVLLPILLITGIASFVVGWNQLILGKILPSFFPLLHMSPLPFTLSIPALSFLLVFRTNSSYGRFDEVRKMWGLMLNRSRDITRQALSYMARGAHIEEKPIRDQFLRHMQSFAIVYKHHFLREGNLEKELRKETSLTNEEIQAILAANHKPNYMLQMMSECLRTCTMDSMQRYSMDQNLTTFADDIGGCERIFKTPIPLSYTRLTSRFLMIWHSLLPFGLYDALGWLTVPATFLSAFLLFCVDEVGVVLEEPFTNLALDAIATSSRTNIAELVEQHSSIKDRVMMTLRPFMVQPQFMQS